VSNKVRPNGVSEIRSYFVTIRCSCRRIHVILKVNIQRLDLLNQQGVQQRAHKGHRIRQIDLQLCLSAACFQEQLLFGGQKLVADSQHHSILAQMLGHIVNDALHNRRWYFVVHIVASVINSHNPIRLLKNGVSLSEIKRSTLV